MRNKRQALAVLYAKGFAPRLCVDVGAAEGTDGLFEADRKFRVVLVEPSPSYLPALQLLAEQLGDAVVVHGVAGATSCDTELGISPEGDFFVRPERKPPDWETIRLRQWTVDEIVAQNLAHVGALEVLLKIDVDGSELEVLAGAERTVALGAVVIVEAVLMDAEVSRFHRILDWFDSRGYCVIDILESMHREVDDLLWQVDLVVVPRNTFLRSEFNQFRAR